jgi:enamine deaminase RidA (YjgF/YER057c/UK114 family)
MDGRVNISSGSPMEGPIGFSRACRIGSVIAVAGTAAIGPDGQTVGANDVYEQTKYCIEIMKRAIEQAGGSIQNVVRTRVMLVDISTWREAARAHGEFFSDIRPACTFVEVKGFINKEWLVETEADCVVPFN